MASSINASTTAGVVTTADTSGVLNIQTAGTTAISIDASQAVTMAGRTSNPTTISVGAATPSTSGAGITFPATQSASSNANTLDDYEEGAWTPSVGGTATYNTTYTVGFYTKIGRQVTLNYSIQITSLGTGNPTTVINAPFPCTSAINECAGTIGYSDGLATAVVSLAPYIAGNTIDIGVVSRTAASVAVAYNNIFNTSSGRYWATLTYIIA